MNKLIWLRRYWLLMISVAMIFFTVISVFSHPLPKLTEPALKLGSSPFKKSIAGTGVVEPQSEIITIGSTMPGIVTDIYVNVGDHVKKNTPLFTIDSRDALARLNAEKAKLNYEIAALNDSKHQLEFYERISDKRAISNEEMVKRRDQVALHEALVHEAQARVDVIKMEIERLTIRSPIAGTILRVSTHIGEYAPTGVLNEPLMIVGNTNVLHVRVEIDETNAQSINPSAKAVGFLRGYNAKEIPLQFVAIEPLLSTKKSLNNQSNELEDMRVLVVIYSFNNKNINAYNGQQMDVYINDENQP